MPATKPGATALRRILQQELLTGRALVALARATESAIIAGDTARLDELAPQQRALLEKQAGLEVERRKAAADMAQKLRLNHVPPLSALLPALAPEDARPLAVLRRQMLETERAMDALNKSNSILLENAIGFVKFNLDALTSAALKPARYGVNLAQIAAPSFYIDSKA
jgi:hypothetical protein